jgi:hypothetical protein
MGFDFKWDLVKTLIRKHLILCICLLTSKHCHGQGLNNDDDIDNEDLKNVLAMMNVDIFKFSFKPVDKFTALNLVIYEYEDGILKDSVNMRPSLQKVAAIYGESALPG